MKEDPDAAGITRTAICRLDRKTCESRLERKSQEENGTVRSMRGKELIRRECNRCVRKEDFVEAL